MSYDQNYPFPRVFLVDEDGGQQHPPQLPNLVPCWSFPPAQERMRSRAKSRGCMGVSYSAALIVMMLFLLVFAALGFEAYQIHRMQGKLSGAVKVEPVPQANEFNVAEKQIGGPDSSLQKDKDKRPAAHVMGRIEASHFPKTLRWDPQSSRAFMSGGVAYRFEDGALQVNESGLYHIYTRVELTFADCSPASSFIHKVFVRRAGRPTPVTLMEAHRAGFCSEKQKHPWTTESYLASTLQLHEYDRVFVNLSHPSFISHGPYANFFGLYKI